MNKRNIFVSFKDKPQSVYAISFGKFIVLVNRTGHFNHLSNVFYVKAKVTSFGEI